MQNEEIKDKVTADNAANTAEETVVADAAVNTEETSEKNSEIDFDALLRKKRFSLFLKRCFDITASALGLLCLALPFIVIAVIIKATSKGPVYFRQVRVGKDGKEFRIFKFRTMVVDAEKKGMQITVGADSRITGIGKFLRKTKIDELPQLINVARGEMGLIGPRPLVYTERQIRFLRRWYGIYQVKPGITGWAQVNGRDTVDVYDKVFYDREYVQKVSLLFDIKIILKSVAVVLGHHGIVDGKIDPQIRRESIVLLRESELRKGASRAEMDAEIEEFEAGIV